MDAPMPLEAPVTTATLPASLFDFVLMGFFVLLGTVLLLVLDLGGARFLGRQPSIASNAAPSNFCVRKPASVTWLPLQTWFQRLLV